MFFLFSNEGRPHRDTGQHLSITHLQAVYLLMLSKRKSKTGSGYNLRLMSVSILPKIM